MKRLARKYWMVIEKDTGYLVGVVPYTRKSDKEEKEDLGKILKLFYELHPSYKGIDFRIESFTRVLQNDSFHN
jgi:hypothetical protein